MKKPCYSPEPQGYGYVIQLINNKSNCMKNTYLQYSNNDSITIV